ncbi:MAG: MFS transporter [Hyphomicrobiaceae bacterium]
MLAWRPFVLILLPFTAGYFLSYVFRTINALIAGALTNELGLSPADLGLLTSVYFLAMAAVQMPLGVLLDRYGPRRVQSACLILAAAGAAVFACASNMLGLLLGRALIGVGVAAALMASLKAIVLWFPNERIALANGWVVMLGALGAVTATLPAEPLVAMLGWRGLFVLLAVSTAACAIAIFVVVPDAERTSAAQSSRVKLRDIYRDARFLRLAPLSTLCIGTAWSLHGLWAAPWLEHVEGLDRPAVVRHLLVMGVALSLGALLLGWGADRLRRRGVARETFLAAIALVFIAAQLALVMRVPVPAYIPWAIIAAVGAATVLSFAILPEYFPKEMSARANAALNILHLGGAFLFQYVTGLIVSLWPPEAGHAPAEAYVTALGLGVVLQIAALLWFLVAAQRTHTPVFRAMQPARRMSPVPSQRAAIIDYGNAQLALARHVARARLQAAHWRRIGIASAALCLCLGITLGIAAQSHVIAHVVEAPAITVAHDSGDGEPARFATKVADGCTVASILISASTPWPSVGMVAGGRATCDIGARLQQVRADVKITSHSQGPQRQ